MRVDEIKSKLDNYVGKPITIKYNLGRNKYENYNVKIKKLYNYMFLVESDDEYKNLKSFSYSDVITKIIKITLK